MQNKSDAKWMEDEDKKWEISETEEDDFTGQNSITKYADLSQEEKVKARLKYLLGKVDQGKGQSRGQAKIEKVLLWLAWWEVSTPSLICHMLGLDPGGQYHFFKKMTEKLKYLHYVDHTCFRFKKICLLTAAGRRYALELDPKLALKCKTTNRYLAESTYAHIFASQMTIIDMLQTPNGINLERIIATDKHPLHGQYQAGKKIPDAIIVSNKKLTHKTKIYAQQNWSIALEAEITGKPDHRIYAGFFAHLKHMYTDDPDYRMVIYYFKSQKLKQNYERLFRNKKWDIFTKKYNKAGKAFFGLDRSEDPNEIYGSKKGKFFWILKEDLI
jgi:hypothetical protein